MGMGSGGGTRPGKKIGVWGMVVVGFFWVHGGIYGNEAMLMAGPPLYVFIMLGVVPFVYSLPIALIVAELSTAFPEDGGYVVWVQQACGRVVGSHHAYWVWVIYAVDAAIYPVLVAQYVDTMVPMSEFRRGILSTALVGMVTGINLLGTDMMVKFNTLLAVVSLAPTVLFVAIGMPRLEPERTLVAHGELDSSLLVSWILWLYCGFFSLGTLAGELEQPRRTFLVSIGILFPAVLLLNTLPLAVALSLDDVPAHYSAGYFNVLARRLAGRWLDYGFQLGANVCLIGLYNAAALTAERSLAFLVASHFTGQMNAVVERRRRSGGRADALLVWLLAASQTGVAPVYILFNAAVAASLVWAPYTRLVEFSMLLSVPSILLFMWSFVALRMKQPESLAARPFRIPGGLPTAVLITVVPVAISISYAVIVAAESFVPEPGAAGDGGHSARHKKGGARRHNAAGHQIRSMLYVIGAGVAVHALVVLLSRRRRQVEAKAAQGASLGSLPLSPRWEEADEAADSRGPSAGLISSKLRHNDGRSRWEGQPPVARGSAAPRLGESVGPSTRRPRSTEASAASIPSAGGPTGLLPSGGQAAAAGTAAALSQIPSRGSCLAPSQRAAATRRCRARRRAAGRVAHL